MSHITDYKRDSMKTVLGSSLYNIDTLEIDYLQSLGATSNQVNNAWMEVFLLNGATSGNWNDAAQEFLIALGAPGNNLSDNWNWFWITNGGVILSYLLQGTGASKTFESGTANYTETDGSIAAAGGVYDVIAQSTPAWGDLGWISSDLNAIASRAFIFTLNGSAIETTELIAGWTDNGLALANFMAAIKIDGSGNVDIYANGAASATAVSTVTNSTDEKFAIVKGGYNASGVPMDAAANITSYPYGASFYQYDGSNWQLIYRTLDVQDTGMDYPAMSFYDYGGDYDAIAVPDVDLSALLVPLALDTFAGTNGDNIHGRSLDVGSTWAISESHGTGVAEIQSNKASNGTVDESAVLVYATTDLSESDVLIEGAFNAGDANGCASGHSFRYSDTDNFWHHQDRCIVTFKFAVYERTTGSWALRANNGVPSENTDYRLITALDGTSIVCWNDDTDRMTYTSASHQSQTKHGFFLSYDNGEVTPATCDLWACWVRGNGGEYSDLGSY